ncbi:tryptophan--tRNA ligase [Candidatus Roizmanbacteria bacterium]|jgi:tryptophanyl-tRNA synthetase|nr:tryptophan--tRNA ligase [Candidatus Roizmanbacteria bacterium]
MENKGKKIIFSGIQPSGNLHLGNYIGAINQWVVMQEESSEKELIFCVVDLHAITVYQSSAVLKEKILEVAALYLACGIDPKKSKIFVQSENPDHSYLAWIFDCLTPMGWMNRMTQFKDKSAKQKESTSVGLFNYPALMAADILLYDTDYVPVGEDQTQHVELTCDIAARFNRLYGENFKLPKTIIDRKAARIMSLQNPLTKMSKSDENQDGVINLLDAKDDIAKKIKKAVTDSGREIVYEQDKPAISNLLVIYSKLSGREINSIEEEYRLKSYADFKNDLAELMVDVLSPVQDKYREIRQDAGYLGKVLDEGREFAVKKSSVKVANVRRAMGLGRI